MNILDFTSKEIVELLEQANNSFKYKTLCFHDKRVTNCYFVGQGLCIDIKIGDEKDVITFSHGEESYSLFSGGLKRLIPLKGLRQLESTMKEAQIKFNYKIF